MKIRTAAEVQACPPKLRRQLAFTLRECLIVLAVAALVLAVAIPTLSAHKRHAQLIFCTHRLKHVGESFHLWGNDYGGKYPMDVPVASGGALEQFATGNVFACFLVTSNYLATPQMVHCPADHVHEVHLDFLTTYNIGDFYTPSNVSYFIGLGAHQSNSCTLLSGDGNLMQKGLPVSAGFVDLETNTTTWTRDRHQGSGNVLFTDGSVVTVSKIGFTNLVGTCYATNLVVVP